MRESASEPRAATQTVNGAANPGRATTVHSHPPPSRFTAWSNTCSTRRVIRARIAASKRLSHTFAHSVSTASPSVRSYAKKNDTTISSASMPIMYFMLVFTMSMMLLSKPLESATTLI